jgi:hypothetical protein
MRIAESAASAPQQPFTCETATGKVETLRSTTDFAAASPAGISPNATPSGGTTSREAAKDVDAAKAPIVAANSIEIRQAASIDFALMWGSIEKNSYKFPTKFLQFCRKWGISGQNARNCREKSREYFSLNRNKWH